MRVSSDQSVMVRSTFFLSLLVSSILLGGTSGCAPSSRSSGQDSPASASQDLPPLAKEIIDERINDTRVYEVLPESGTGDPIPWGFDHDQPKEIVVIDQQMNGSKATIILDIKTQSSPRARTQRHLAGQIRTEWSLETGWVLRRWEIVNTENISMKYRDLPK